jgi:ParB-like chromosome segregation protein Spo0J
MANRSRDLSPVDLIKVDNAYFVVDGHHRLSVAQALGQTEITANVIDYAIEPPQ